MADIAMVFNGWTPDLMWSFTEEELMRWHGLALARFKLLHQVK